MMMVVVLVGSFFFFFFKKIQKQHGIIIVELQYLPSSLLVGNIPTQKHRVPNGILIQNT